MLGHMIVTLNTTVPFMLLAALGVFLKRKGMIDDKFVSMGNKVIFYFAIPATVFNHIHRADLSAIFDMWFLVFNSIWLVFFFIVTWVLAVMLMKDKKSVAPFVNSAYRSSLSVVAPPLLVLMAYGVTDPDFLPKGILAVSILLILSYTTASILFAVHDSKEKKISGIGILMDAIKSVVKNPIVIAVVVALIFNFFGWTLHFGEWEFAQRTVTPLAMLVMPLAMICVGANLKFHGFDRKFKYVLVASIVKLFLMPIASIIVAYLFGFRGSDLTIIMILNALPMAVGAYVMQAELGGDTYIGASTLMITMVFSAFTLTLFIFLFRVMGFLV